MMQHTIIKYYRSTSGFFLFPSRRRHTRLQGDWSSDVCFFVSSRRRHTRLQGDWSSDVCSSDLIPPEASKQLHLGAYRNANTRMLRSLGRDMGFDSIGDWPQAAALATYLDRLDRENSQIGRASCRERV